MSRNLFKKLDNPETNIGLNPFDLSQRKLYSSRCGMLTPTLVLDCVKGDKFEIDVTTFNRSNRLIAPAFFRCKQYNHFFFVPYNTLWHNFDVFFTRSTEKLSSMSKGSAYTPNVDIVSFLYHMQDSSNSSFKDMMGYPSKYGIDRLCQLLGYAGVDCVPGNDGSTSRLDIVTANPKYVNLFKILAYNKIWYWFYRDKRHTSPALTNNIDWSTLYNVDDVDCSSFDSSHIDVQSDIDRLILMFSPKYRLWDSDVFSNSFQNTQFGDVSVMSSDVTRIINKVPYSEMGSGITASVANSALGTNLNVRNLDGVVAGSNQWSIPNLFNILSLRRAESVQHWRELMLRAGDSSKDRYRAMLGSNPNRANEVPIYIDGFDVNLNIDDVTSTSFDSDTPQENSGLGEMAGKGIMANSSRKIKFTSPEYGVLMCITTFVPLCEYDGTYIDKGNTLLESNDFYIPQYDRLGFEPVVKSEQVLSVGDLQLTYNNWNSVLGYTVRNHYLKTAVDRVYNNFRSNKLESYWSTPRADLQFTSAGYPVYRNYYVDPAVINPLFSQSITQEDGISYQLYYAQDSFKCMSYFQIKALRPMSELGLPPM